MIILAVGLLAVEAMGIGAARLVARADRQSEFTSLATADLEAALNQFRTTGAVGGGVRNDGPATVTRVATVLPGAIISGGPTITSVMVQVTVSPRTGQNHLLHACNGGGTCDESAVDRPAPASHSWSWRWRSSSVPCSSPSSCRW